MTLHRSTCIPAPEFSHRETKEPVPPQGTLERLLLRTEQTGWSVVYRQTHATLYFVISYIIGILASFGHFSTPLGPSVRRLGFRPCRSCRSCRVWRLSPIALHPDCQRAHSPNVSIRHTGSLRRAGGPVSGNSPLFRRFSIPASSSASHSVATDHCSRAAVLPYSPLATRHSPLATRHYLLRPSPRWQLPSTNRRIAKDRTGPDLDERPLFVSMSPKQAIRADKIN